MSRALTGFLQGSYSYFADRMFCGAQVNYAWRRKCYQQWKEKKNRSHLKSLKIIWVFSKKKDAESDLSFSLMYQHPAEDTEKQLFVESSPQGKEAVAIGRAGAGGKQR